MENLNHRQGFSEEAVPLTQHNNEIVLGDPKIFIIKRKDGIAKAVRADVPLSKNEGDFHIIQGRPSISSKGYNKLNQVAGISVIQPQMIGDNMNPILEYDKDSGATSKVIIRKIGVGYSPIGNLCVIDETVSFDTSAYFKQEVFRKWKKFRHMGEFQYNPNEDIAKKVFVPIIGRAGILLDMKHPESINLMNEYLNRQKFAERIAASIARRNCLKAHPAIATSTIKFKGRQAIVTVYGFKLDYNHKKIENIVEDASRGVVRDNAELIEHNTIADSDEVEMETASSGDPEHDKVSDNKEIPDTQLQDQKSTIEKIVDMMPVIGSDKYQEIVPDTVFDMDESGQEQILSKLYGLVTKKNKGL